MLKTAASHPHIHREVNTEKIKANMAAELAKVDAAIDAATKKRESSASSIFTMLEEMQAKLTKEVQVSARVSQTDRDREGQRLGASPCAWDTEVGRRVPHAAALNHSRRSRRLGRWSPVRNRPRTLHPSGINHVDRRLKFWARAARQAETAMRGGIEDHLLTLIENAAANVDKTLEKQME